MIHVNNYAVHIGTNETNIKKRFSVKELRGNKNNTLSAIRHRLARKHNCNHTEIFLNYFIKK